MERAILRSGSRRRGLSLVLLLALGAVLALPGAAGAQQPPRDLHFVDGHWTAWDPPVPPPDAEVHVIQRGDTLWDLARRYYGDPYLWPQLWEQNRYILDAHWIYPGDPLVIGFQVAPVDDLAELWVDPEEAASLDEATGDGILSAGAAAGAPAPLGSESDLYCSGYIAHPERTFPHTIVGSEYEVLVPGMAVGGSYDPDSPYGELTFGGRTMKVGMVNGDIVYLGDGRAAGLQAGQQFSVVAAEGLVRHPIGRAVVGRFYRHLGRVQVLSVQEETAIAEIVHACDPIPVGSLLEAFRPEPVPLGRLGAPPPVNLPPTAAALEGSPVILRGEDQVISLAEDSLVYIDQGESDDVVPGDLFTIYRLNRPGMPPVVLGELAVLAVHERSSVARILRSRHTVYVGDRLERTPGRP